MFNKNKDNKLGINDTKIGKNDSPDLGNNKNNKKKKWFWNWNKQKNIGNKKITKITKIKGKKIYITEKAKEDSKNDQMLKIIDLKTSSLARMYEIRDIYIECNECAEIFKNELLEMMKKLSKQAELRKTNIAGILPKEGEKYVIGNPPALYGAAGSIDTQIVNYQNQYLENYKAMKPPYFHPCEKHFKLAREWQSLDIKIKDYETLIKNDMNQ